MIGPVREAGADGFEETLDFVDGELLRERQRREFGFERNFGREGVAGAAEKGRIGEGAVESVVCGEKLGGETLESGVEDFQAAWVESTEAVFAGDHMERGAFLRACFGPEKRAGGKVEGG